MFRYRSVHTCIISIYIFTPVTPGITRRAHSASSFRKKANRVIRRAQGIQTLRTMNYFIFAQVNWHYGLLRIYHIITMIVWTICDLSSRTAKRTRLSKYFVKMYLMLVIRCIGLPPLFYLLPKPLNSVERLSHFRAFGEHWFHISQLWDFRNLVM